MEVLERTDARHIDAYQSRIFEKGAEAGLERNIWHMKQNRTGDTEQTQTAGGSDPFRLRFCDSIELSFVTLPSLLLHLSGRKNACFCLLNSCGWGEKGEKRGGNESGHRVAD
jgi:hypothetical protein